MDVVQSLTRVNVVCRSLNPSKNWPTINWGPSKTHASSKSWLKSSSTWWQWWGNMRVVVIVKEILRIVVSEVASTRRCNFADIDGDNWCWGLWPLCLWWGWRWWLGARNSCVLLAEFYIQRGRPMHHPWNVFVLNFKGGFSPCNVCVLFFHVLYVLYLLYFVSGAILQCKSMKQCS